MFKNIQTALGYRDDKVVDSKKREKKGDKQVESAPLPDRSHARRTGFICWKTSKLNQMGISEVHDLTVLAVATSDVPTFLNLCASSAVLKSFKFLN